MYTATTAFFEVYEAYFKTGIMIYKWKFSILKSDKIWESIYGIHGNVFLWLYVKQT
jgi:hypothetical protein